MIMLSQHLGGSIKISHFASRFQKFLRTALPALFLPGLLSAQRYAVDHSGLQCAACSFFAIVPIAFIILNICILIWVAKDAKARGMDTPILWMILVLFTSFIGMIIYRGARPKGEMTPCSNCNNQKLRHLVKCPHCGADSGQIVQSSI